MVRRSMLTVLTPSLMAGVLPILMAVNCDPPSTAPAVPTTVPSTTQLAVCGGESARWRAVTDRRLVGDTLEFDVEYFGGCAVHEFTLCWEGGLITLPEQPPMMRMLLDHWYDDDACDDRVSESFSFDLTEPKNTALSIRPNADVVLLLFDDETIEWRIQ